MEFMNGPVALSKISFNEGDGKYRCLTIYDYRLRLMNGMVELLKDRIEIVEMIVSNQYQRSF